MMVFLFDDNPLCFDLVSIDQTQHVDARGHMGDGNGVSSILPGKNDSHDEHQR